MHRAPRRLLAALVGLSLLLGLSPAPAWADQATLTGVITDAETGKPVADVNVSAWKIFEHGPRVVASGHTNAAGEYTLTPVTAPLPAGNYPIQLERSGYVTEYSGNRIYLEDAVEVAIPGTFNEAIVRTATISGTLTDEHGVPVPLGSATITPAKNNIFGDKRSLNIQKGKYSAIELAPGTYTVEFSVSGRVRQWSPLATDQAHAAKIHVKSGENTLSDKLLPAPTGVVRGTVTDKSTNAPMEGVCLDLSGTVTTDPERACTDSDGAYEFTGVATQKGKLAVTRRPNLYLPQSVPVAAVDGKTVVVDVQLAQGGQLQGVMADAQGTPTRDRFCLEAHHLDGSLADSQCYGAGTGAFTTHSLRGGPYRLKLVAREGAQYGVGWLTVGGTTVATEAEASVFVVRPRKTTDTGTLRFSPAGTISGVVTDKITGEPIPNVCVGAGKVEPHGNGWDNGSTCTGEDGRYSIADLGPGNWVLQYFTRGPYAHDFSGGAATRRTATAITLAAGQSVTANMALSAGAGSLTGTIEIPHGRMYSIEVVNAEDGDYVASIQWGTLTDGKGTYTVENISPQNVKIVVHGVNGDPHWYGGKSFTTATVVEITAGTTVVDIKR